MVGIERNLNDCDRDRESALAEVLRLESEIAAIEQKIFANFNAQVGVKSVQQYEESRIRYAQESSKKRVEFNVLISRLRSELDSERQRDLQKPLKFLNEKYDSESKKMKKIRKSIELNQQSLEKMQLEMKSSELSLRNLGEEMNAQQELLKKYESKSSEISSKMSKKVLACMLLTILGTLESDLGDLESEVEKLKSRRHDLLNQCRLERVELPLLSPDEKNEFVDLDENNEVETFRLDFEGLLKIPYHLVLIFFASHSVNRFRNIGSPN